MLKTLTVTMPPISMPNMSNAESLSPDADSITNDILINAYSRIPLTALSDCTRRKLSTALNREKILPSEEGYERDWRGVAMIALKKSLNIGHVMNQDDPMARVIHLWCTNSAETATFECLEHVLGKIDRWDVCDDINENLVEDAKKYTEKLTNGKPDPQPSRKNSNDDTFGYGADENILTTHDVARKQQGLPPQKYDAFVLFADADIEYATEVLKKLEDEPNAFKLCVKDRDLLLGVCFEHVALTKLIEERCKRLIVILTENFLQSPENKFLVDYTQAHQIQHGTRKIIPIIYDNTALPRTLKIFCHLKYNADTFGLYNFWTRLADSIRSVDTAVDSTSSPIDTRNNNIKTTQKINQNNSTSTPSPMTDIPKINVNGNPLEEDFDNVPKKKERFIFKKRFSLRSASKDKLNSNFDNNAVLRSAHSCNQLNSSLLFTTNLPQMSGLSASTCSGDDKKKKKWSSKLFKKVFSRSSNRLMA